jgi:hypothetical protein
MISHDSISCGALHSKDESPRPAVVWKGWLFRRSGFESSSPIYKKSLYTVSEDGQLVKFKHNPGDLTDNVCPLAPKCRRLNIRGGLVVVDAAPEWAAFPYSFTLEAADGTNQWLCADSKVALEELFHILSGIDVVISSRIAPGIFAPVAAPLPPPAGSRLTLSNYFRCVVAL